MRAFYLFVSIFALMTLVFNINSRLPRLPWDINLDQPGIKVYLPLISSIVISVVIAILFNFS